MGRTKLKGDAVDAANNKNVQAFLATIRRFESGDDYYILYGGGHFSDDSSHPHVKVPFHNPLRSGEGINDFSTAAGAYQINWPTWLTIQAGAFLPDFSPASQDEAAIWLLNYHGVLPDIIAGNFASAMSLASGTWASLPGSDARQNPQSLQTVMTVYKNNGGTVV